jgi:hypothetical protein
VRLGSDAFQTRLLLQEVTCANGDEAAELFYGRDLFTRVGAMPVTVLKLLQDRGSAQLLEGGEHRRRKRMFISLMTPESIASLVKRRSARGARTSRKPSSTAFRVAAKWQPARFQALVGGKVTKRSDALDLEEGVFKKRSPHRIALPLSAGRRRILEQAKDEFRKVFGRE